MANLLSELERFEQEMKDLGSEPSSFLPPPAHLVARLPLPPPPPPPSHIRLSAPPSNSAVQLLPDKNGVSLGNTMQRLPPTVLTHTGVRNLPNQVPQTLLNTSAGLSSPPTILTPPGAAPVPWLNSGAAGSAAQIGPAVPPNVVSQYTYSQPPTSFTSTATSFSGPPLPPVSAPSSSYFPVPFHLQQHSQAHPQNQQYQQQSYQQGPVQYSAQPQVHSQPQVSQPAVIQAVAQSSYQYQAGYQPAAVAPAAAPPAPSGAPEIFALPQQQQAQQLFQRDAQTITQEALESVKAALASGEGEHKSEARKRAVPRKAAGQSWADPTLADWPENDHRLFCGDLGNEVNDEVLTKAFTKFATFNMARVVRDKRTGKTKGYGFVSFANPSDLALAFKEMNGKYVGNRPIKLRKSTWKERTDQEAFDKHKNSKRQKTKKTLLHK